MTETPLVAVDIGGTHARFAMSRAGASRIWVRR
jgi:glucokinase